MDTIRNSIEAYRSEIMKLGFSGKRLLKANTALAQIEAMHDAEGSISVSQLIVRSYEESILKRLNHRHLLYRLPCPARFHAQCKHSLEYLVLIHSHPPLLCNRHPKIFD